MGEKLSIIYDITKKCPLKCPICCMCATDDSDVLENENELSQERKISLMNELKEINQFREIYIDFSGGEIFTNMDNVDVIEIAADLFGKDHVGISTSGYQMSDELAKRLSNCISYCEMTMDTVPRQEYSLRPTDYSIKAENAIPLLKKYNINIGIQTVLAHSNCKKTSNGNYEILKEIYNYLCEKEIDKWSLLKFYPSGRGSNYRQEILDETEEEEIVKFIKNLDKKNTFKKKPEIDFHYNIKGHEKYSTECRGVRKSIGILPDGTVTACFWALDSTGKVIDDYLLGSVKENTLKEILESKKAKEWSKKVHKCELLEKLKMINI